MAETIQEKIEKSPFRNIYWFARYLIDSDSYSSIGRTKETKMLQLVTILDNIRIQKDIEDGDKLATIKTLLEENILKLYKKKNSKVYYGAENFISLMNEELKTLDDVAIFCITMRYIVAPINQAIKQIPTNDKEFSEKTAASLLKACGSKKAGVVIKTWDNLGVKGCLDIERSVVVEEFSNLLDNLTKFDINYTKFDNNLIMTAFVQEFERRLAQKRKTRGGSSLENVVDFLFDYYKLKSSQKPSHFDTNFEVDKWFKTGDGWYIGISCKRTLRERWKQVNIPENELSHHKIKFLWHVVTYDKDLSDDKITIAGSQRQIFYLLDDSNIYKRCKTHTGMKSYVRPLSQFIEDIKKEQKKKK